MDFNQITITGRLTSDAELRYTKADAPVLRFSVANNPSKEEKKAIFFECSLFGKIGETLQSYLKKGQAVVVAGEFSPHEYKTSSGEKKTSLDILARAVTLLGKPAGESGFAKSAGSSHDEPEFEDDFPF